MKLFRKKQRRIDELEFAILGYRLLIAQAASVMDRAGEKLTLEPDANKEPVAVGTKLHKSASELIAAVDRVES